MPVLFPFLAALFFVIFPVTMTAEKPFSFKDTPGKLPKEVVPTDYSIRIIHRSRNGEAERAQSGSSAGAECA